MLKDFIEATLKRIRVDRMLGYCDKGNFIRSFKRGEDYLDIFRSGPNDYTIYFSSFNPKNRWWHHNITLKEVVCAIKSFDGMTDMFGNPFHDEVNGIFEY